MTGKTDPHPKRLKDSLLIVFSRTSLTIKPCIRLSMVNSNQLTSPRNNTTGNLLRGFFESAKRPKSPNSTLSICLYKNTM